MLRQDTQTTLKFKPQVIDVENERQCHCCAISVSLNSLFAKKSDSEVCQMLWSKRR